MDEQTQRNLKNIMVMVLVDGELNDQEELFLESLRDRTSIDPKDFQVLRDEARRNPTRLSIPKGAEGTDALKLLIQAALADGEISEREKTVIQKVANYLELSDSMVNQLIDEEQLSPEEEEKLNHLIEEFYAQYNHWDDSTRRQKLGELESWARPVVVPVLRMIESYRTPDEAEDALDFKTDLAHLLGRLGDERAVYYLAQQISLGDDVEDISSPELRLASADAIEQITGRQFDPSDKLEDARKWWRNDGQTEYNHLAF